MQEVRAQTDKTNTLANFMKHIGLTIRPPLYKRYIFNNRRCKQTPIGIKHKYYKCINFGFIYVSFEIFIHIYSHLFALAICPLSLFLTLFSAGKSAGVDFSGIFWLGEIERLKRFLMQVFNDKAKIDSGNPKTVTIVLVFKHYRNLCSFVVISNVSHRKVV